MSDKRILFSPEDNDIAGEPWYVDNCGYARRVLRNKTDWRRRELRAAHRVVLSRILGRELTSADICDHANGVRLDNRRCNLRLVTRLQNCQNRQNDNPYRGASFARAYGKWKASVSHLGQKYHGGFWKSREEAAAAAAAIRRKLGFLGS